MPSPKIQISFQGGGAKFATLLPAVDAALDAHQRGLVTITRVSGSSAGAIAAALLAAKADFSKLTNLLEGPKLHELIGNLTGRLSKVILENGEVKFFKMLALVWSVVKGESVAELQQLRDLLEYLFVELCGSLPGDFENLKSKSGIELLITSSDLIRQRGRLVKDGDVIDAILDSCALPFYYRNYKHLSTNSVIDGGICDNLPVQYLRERKEDFGEIFAVCLSPKGFIDRSYPIPKNIFSYGWAIWSAVANDANRRTREMLNSTHVIDLSSEENLINFKGAFDTLKERERYEALKDQVTTKFVDYAQLQSFGDVSEKITVSGHLDARELMAAISDVYDKYFDTRAYKIKRASYIVRADCLDRFNTGKSRRADQITREVILELPSSAETPLNCIQSYIDPDGHGSYTSTRWSAEFEKSKKKIKFDVIPAAKRDSDPKTGIRCLLFFKNPVVGSDADGYRVRISSHYAKSDAMFGLQTNGSDFISTANGHQIDIDRVDIVLCSPKQVGQVAVARDPRHSTVEKGIPITDHIALDEYRYFQSADYNVSVYSAENLKPGEVIAARFTRID